MLLTKPKYSPSGSVSGAGHPPEQPRFAALPVPPVAPVEPVAVGPEGCVGPEVCVGPVAAVAAVAPVGLVVVGSSSLPVSAKAAMTPATTRTATTIAMTTQNDRQSPPSGGPAGRPGRGAVGSGGGDGGCWLGSADTPHVVSPGLSSEARRRRPGPGYPSSR